MKTAADREHAAVDEVAAFGQLFAAGDVERKEPGWAQERFQSIAAALKKP